MHGHRPIDEFPSVVTDKFPPTSGSDDFAFDPFRS